MTTRLDDASNICGLSRGCETMVLEFDWLIVNAGWLIPTRINIYIYDFHLSDTGTLDHWNGINYTYSQGANLTSPKWRGSWSLFMLGCYYVSSVF